MRILAAVLGVLAAVVVAVFVAVTLGEFHGVWAFLAAVGLVVLVVAAGNAGSVRRVAMASVGVVLAGAAFGAWQAAAIVHALTGTDGEVARADPIALASARAKMDEASLSSTFRLELTEAELEAMVQDGLEADSPLQRVRVTIVDGPDPRGAILVLDGEFKRGAVSVRATVSARAEAGIAVVRIESVDMGMISVPGALVMNDLEQAIATITEALIAEGTRIDEIVTENRRLIAVGR